VVKLDRKAGYVVTYDYLPLSYLNGTVTWSLTLVDRKIQPVSPTQTVSETFGQPTPATECPAYMTEIVRWPAL
jgi:hypothetical protein